MGNAANEQVKPSLYISTEVKDVEGRMVLICSIPEGRSKPYKDIGGTIWIKQGADKRRVTENSEILGLFQSSGTYQADLAGVPGTSVRDLDKTAVESYFSKIYGQVPDDFETPAENMLQSLNITDSSGRLTVAGLLYFGRHPPAPYARFRHKSCQVRRQRPRRNEIPRQQRHRRNYPKDVR